jgi:hypothetical protein
MLGRAGIGHSVVHGNPFAVRTAGRVFGFMEKLLWLLMEKNSY